MTQDRPTPPPPPPLVATPPPYPVYAQPRPARRSVWTWIVIIVGCYFGFMVIMALIVPQMLKVKKSANQTSAVQTIRTIGSAEVSYASLYPSNGYGCPLSVLGGNPQQTGSATAQAAQLIPADLAASGQKSGYTFAIACGAKATVNGQDVYTSYQLTAVPQTVGKSGDNGYCSDENNVIKIDPAGGSNCTEPLQ